MSELLEWAHQACLAALIISTPGGVSSKHERVIRSSFERSLINLSTGTITKPRTVEYQKLEKRASDSAFGFADTKLDQAAFLCASHVELGWNKGVFLDIGTGYGAMSREALKKGARRVLAVDINSFQLATTFFNTPEKDQDRLTLVFGKYPFDFPDSIKNLPFTRYQQALKDSPEIAAGVGIVWGGQVAHFLDLPSTARKLYAMGTPDMVGVLTAASPYNLKFKDFVPIFEKRLEAGDPNAGLVKTLDYLSPEEAKFYPEQMNLLIPRLFEAPFEAAGFRTSVRYYSAPRGRKDIRSDDLKFAGRERVRLFFWKPGRKRPFVPESTTLDSGATEMKLIPTRP